APKQIAGLFFQFMRILGKGGFASDNLESSVTQPTPLRPLYPRLPRRSPPTSAKKSGTLASIRRHRRSSRSPSAFYGGIGRAGVHFHPLTDFRQRVLHGYLADPDEISGALEIVVGESCHIRFDDDIGCATPERGHRVLRDGERLSYHVE